MELAPQHSPTNTLLRHLLIAGRLVRDTFRQSILVGATVGGKPHRLLIVRQIIGRFLGQAASGNGLLLRSRSRRPLVALAALLLTCASQSLQAQTTTQRLLLQSKKYVSLSGSAGFSGEAYSTTGNSRRPSLSGRSFMQASLNVLGIRTGLNLLYSTEQNRVRQSLNKIGFESTWRWVKVGIGDTYPRYSEFSLNGLQLQGASVDLSPRKLRISIATGRTQRATETDAAVTGLEGANSNTYRRNVTAIRLGLGDLSGNHFHLIGMKARDDTLSIRTRGSSPPAENLSLSSLAGFSLFSRRFTLAIDGTISAHNRDLFAREIDSDALLDPDSTDLPTAILPFARFISRFFTPTISTSVGYAVQGMTSIRVRNMNLRAQYKRVGPGFTSLGVFSIRNDLEQWRVMPAFRLVHGRVSVSLNYGKSQNNLSRQRASSRERDQLGINLRAQISPAFTLGTGFQQGSNEIRPEIDNPALRRRQVTQRVSLNPTLIIKHGSRTDTFNLSATYQRFEDQRSRNSTQGQPQGQPQATADFQNLSGNLSWFGNITDGLNLHATVSMLRIQSTKDTNVWGLNTGATRDLFERKLNLGLTLGATRTSRSSGSVAQGKESSLIQLTANLTAGYRITNADQFRLSIRGLRSQNTATGSPSFSEIRSQFHYSHRF